MITAIMEAVSTAINAEFGDGYEIHMEEMSQDLKEPCFFIQCLEPENELFRGRKYFRRSQFCIQYFPLSQDGRNRECYSVLDRLCTCLEYIRMDGLMRGTGMHGRVGDGMLSFFVNYDCFTYRKEEETTGIGEMVSGTRVKEGD